MRMDIFDVDHGACAVLEAPAFASDLRHPPPWKPHLHPPAHKVQGRWSRRAEKEPWREPLSNKGQGPGTIRGLRCSPLQWSTRNSNGK